MEEKAMRFGEYIRKKRLSDPRELTMQDVGNHLGISTQYVSEIEKGRRKPLNGERLERLASFLRLSEEDSATMYDLASRENHEVPYDIENTLMGEEVGDLVRFALRQSKAGFIFEDDWKELICKAKKRKSKAQEDGDDD